MNVEATTIKNDALVMVHLRNNFYRRKFRFILAIHLLSIAINVVLVGILIYLMRHPTEPLYFPTDKIGRLLHEPPLYVASIPTEDVSNWAVEAIETAYSYDFINYRAQLQNAQKYFTNYGWQSYMQALTASNNFRALTVRKFVVVAKVVAPPKLLVQGVLAGAYSWKFEMPVLVTYLYPPFNDQSKFQNPLIVTMIVQRQSLLQSYQGLGVLQLIANIAVNP